MQQQRNSKKGSRWGNAQKEQVQNPTFAFAFCCWTSCAHTPGCLRLLGRRTASLSVIIIFPHRKTSTQPWWTRAWWTRAWWMWVARTGPGRPDRRSIPWHFSGASPWSSAVWPSFFPSSFSAAYPVRFTLLSKLLQFFQISNFFTPISKGGGGFGPNEAVTQLSNFTKTELGTLFSG